MEYAKITVKSNYDVRGDLVLRSYIRALIKIKAIDLLDASTDINYQGPYLNSMNKGYIYGIVDDDDVFRELFTGRIIPYDDYQTIDIKEYAKVFSLPKSKKMLIKKVIENVLFDEKNELDFDISTMEELAVDRNVEFVAFDRSLSRINPYQRLSNNKEDNYNNFFSKLDAIKKMKLEDSYDIEQDEYEVKSFWPRQSSQKIYRK